MSPSHQVPHSPRVRLRSLISASVILSMWLALSQAQVRTAITPDGTLGTAVTQRGNVYSITGGSRPGQGPNLFHSFDRFSVGTNDTAHFDGPTGIENILSRVTGGQQSVIDGRLQSTILGANLYLLNPSGVLFGPHATLDVSGSFHVSTADALRFADGATFSAHLGEKTTLTVAPPVAFGFLSAQPAPITIQGSTLQVADGKALSVVGGDITIVGNGALTANSVPTLGGRGGRIQLASVASPGEVVFSPLELAPDLQVDSFARLGRITLSQGAFLDASGNGGGAVLLRAGRLRVDGSWMFAHNSGPLDGTGVGLDLRVAADAVFTNGAFLTADSLGPGRARDVRLTAGSVDIDAALIGSRPWASGNGGNIGVQVGSLTLTRGGEIDGSTAGSGRGGDVTIVAREAIALAGHGSLGPSGIFGGAHEDSRGDAGRLSISTPLLTMDDGALTTTQAARGSQGKAGDLEVRVGRLMLSGGAQIDSSTFGRGHGGDLTVVATDTIALTGMDQDGNPSGLFSNSDVMATGDAGRLSVSAPRLALTDGAEISSGTFGSGRGGDVTIVASEAITLAGQNRGMSSGLFNNSAAKATGDAGRLSVSAPRLAIAEGGVISGSTRGSGRGGDVTVAATDVSLGRNGRIVSATLGDGRAGDLTIGVERLTVTDGAQIASGSGAIRLSDGAVIAGRGQGGRLAIAAKEAISISGPGSGISDRTFGSGDAGNLSIASATLAMADGGQIRATTSGSGRGGSINVQVRRLTLTGGAQISGSSLGTGRGGNVTIAATEDIELSQGGTIAASSSEQGDAGNIVIQAGQIFRSRNGAVTTAAETADGGNITLTAGSLLELHESQLTATVKSGTGKGGNITIDPRFVILEGSQIRADAFGGPGGNVHLVTEVLLADPASQVSASSTLGVQGTVDIRALVTNLSGVVIPLPPDFARTAALLRDRCAARQREGAVSSLVERGRDAVPAAPDGVLPSRSFERHVGTDDAAEAGRRSNQAPLSRQTKRRATSPEGSPVQGWDCAGR